jgi:hypothetical protein
MKQKLVYVYHHRPVRFDPKTKPKAVVTVPGRAYPQGCIQEVSPESQQLVILNRLWKIDYPEYRKGEQFLMSLEPIDRPRTTTTFGEVHPLSNL